MSVVKDWCNTEVKCKILQFTWTINNFYSLTEEKGESLISSTFPTEDSEIKWCLRLYPGGECEESKDCVSLYLQALSLDNKKVNTNIMFTIINAKHEHTNTMYTSHMFTKLECWGFKRFVRRDSLLLPFPDRKLKIYCEINMIGQIVNTASQPSKIPVLVNAADSLTKDLATLFESPKFSDVILSVEGCEFKVHKDILSVRSPVFAAMFEHEMEEQKNNRVEITDINQQVLKEMLRFIYTGKVTNLKQIAADLLIAADKYALDNLKSKCEEALYKNLSVVNVIDILLLADMYRADKLKIKAIEFIKANAKNVMDTGKWKSVAKSRVPITFHLFSEMLQGLSIEST